MKPSLLSRLHQFVFRGIPRYIASVSRSFGAFLVKRALWLTFFGWLAVGWLAIQTVFSEVNPLDAAAWTEGEDPSTALRDYLWAWSFPLGALLVSLTLVNALRRTRVLELQAGVAERRSETAERELLANISGKRDEVNAAAFSKAVDLLTKDDRVAVVGGICALEELMLAAFEDVDNPRRIAFGRQIGSFLASFVRQRSDQLRDKTDGADDKIDRDLVSFDAILALARSWPPQFRPPLSSEGGVNLTGVELRFWHPPSGVDLSCFNFTQARFFQSSIKSANLKDTSFSQARIGHCEFTRCIFVNSTLFMANATECEFSKCEFSHSLFRRTNFFECDFEDSSFRDCDWRFSNLRSPDLSRTEFIETLIEESENCSSDVRTRINSSVFETPRWLDGQKPIVPERLRDFIQLRDQELRG